MRITFSPAVHFELEALFAPYWTAMQMQMRIALRDANLPQQNSVFDFGKRDGFDIPDPKPQDPKG
jgi:hypothetical protein